MSSEKDLLHDVANVPVDDDDSEPLNIFNNGDHGLPY